MKALEPRVMYTGTTDPAPQAASAACPACGHSPCNCIAMQLNGNDYLALPAVKAELIQQDNTVYGSPAETIDLGGSFANVAGTVPLSSMPDFHSNPSASVKIYVSFKGEAAFNWDGTSVPVTPAFDTDGDATTFSSSELSIINETLLRVAEKYSPFNVDVTNVDPGNITNLQTMKVVVGSNSSWTSNTIGGIANISSFASRFFTNVCYIFSQNLASNAKYMAEGIAHEAGHTFGLSHQSTYSGTTLVNAYNTGDSLRAPIMGTSYYSARGVWWIGPTDQGSTTSQNDVSVITSAANGFGYRTDDYGNTTATASVLSLSGGAGSIGGVIEKITDVDTFSFTLSSSSTVTIGGSIAQYGGMLDMSLELYNGSGTLVTSKATSSLGESISSSLSAGTYYVMVKSAGNTGDLGQYTVAVNAVATSGGPVAAVGGAYSASEGGTVSLSAANSTGAGLTYAWDLNGNGIFGETGAAATRGDETGVGVTFNASGLDGPSTYNVTLRVTDGSSQTSTLVVPISITDVAPVVSLSGATTGMEGTAVTVNFSATDAGGDSVTSWVVTWGDGTTSTYGGTATSGLKTYADNGNYNVVVTAINKDGSGSSSRAIAVSNVAPTLTVVVPTGLMEGTGFTLNFSASDPGTDTVTSWLVDWGDGTTSSYAGNISTASKTYGDNGSYLIRVTATDEDSSYSTTGTATVANVAPTILLSKSGTLAEGSVMTLNFSATDSGTDTISAWKVEWGDGTTSTYAGTLSSATKIYGDNGSYTVRVTATDEDGSYVSSTSAAISNVAPTIQLATSGTLTEGSTTTLSFTATDPGSDTISAWKVEWGDGSTSTYAGTLSSATKTYADNGSYTIRVTATDEDGATVSTTSAAIANVAPSIVLATSGTLAEGAPLTLSFSATDPGMDTISAWKVEWGDGTTSTYAGTISSAARTYASSGNYTIRVTATDEDGSYTASTTAAIAWVAPVITLGTSGPYFEGSPMTLSFSATTVGTSAISGWKVEWGDGSTSTYAGTVSSATKSYADNGVYSIRVTATNADGAFVSSTSASIANVAPVITIGKSGTFKEGSALGLTFSAADVGADTVSGWRVEWGDGTISTYAGNISSASKVYADDGSYSIRVTATDEDGSYSATTVATIANVAPTLSLTTSTNNVEGSPFTLGFSAIDPGADTISSWTVEWGDGSTSTYAGNVSSVTKTYADDGTYNVRVTAIDEDGSTTAITQTVVANVVPTVTVTKSGVFEEGSLVTLNFTATDPGADTISAWKVEWGDGSTSTYAGSVTSVTHTFADNGSFTARVTATDEDGSVVRTIALPIVDVAPVLTVTSASSVVTGTPHVVQFSASDVGADTVSSWSIAWGDGGVSVVSGTTTSASRNYVNPGNYVITITATNEDGSFSTTRSVKVSAASLVVSVNSPVALTEGETATLSWSARGNTSYTVSEWKVAWGDGTTSSYAGTVASASKAYTDSGNYIATVTAVGSLGLYSGTATIAVSNVAPSLSVVSNGPVAEGSPFTVNLAATDLGSDTVSSWNIDWGDGTTSSYTGSTTSVSKVYSQDGNYSVSITATDEDGSYSSAINAVITAAPVSVSATGASTARAGSAYTVNFSAPAAGAKSITGWRVAWGDETVTLPATATSATYMFSAGGDYVVTVTALDPAGAVSASPIGVRVTEVAPVVPQVSVPGQSVASSLTQLSFGYLAPGGQVVSGWTIDWGDGVVEAAGANASSAVHRYEAGTYSIIATLRLEDGTTISSPVTTQAISGSDLISTTAPTHLAVGKSARVTFSAGNLLAPLNSGWQIDWGDGTIDNVSASASSATHSYAVSGTFAVRTASMGADGELGAVSNVLTVDSIVPQINLPKAIAAGQMASVTFGVNSSAASLVTGWTLDWGDGTVETLDASAAVASHEYAAASTYTVIATAMAGDAVASASSPLTVWSIPTSTDSVTTAQATVTSRRQVDIIVDAPAWPSEISISDVSFEIQSPAGERIAATLSSDEGGGRFTLHVVTPRNAWDRSDAGTWTIFADAGFGEQKLSTVDISPAAGNVELEVVSASFAAKTSSLLPGAEIKANASVKFSGSPFSGKTTVAFYLSEDGIWDESDRLLTSAPISGKFKAGQTKQVSAKFILPTGIDAGQYQLLTIVDDASQIAEANENNNIRSAGLMAVANPIVDFSQSALTFLGKPSGKSRALQLSLRNTGNVAATDVSIHLFLRTADGQVIQVGSASTGKAKLTPNTLRNIKLTPTLKVLPLDAVIYAVVSAPSQSSFSTTPLTIAA